VTANACLAILQDQLTAYPALRTKSWSKNRTKEVTASLVRHVPQTHSKTIETLVLSVTVVARPVKAPLFQTVLPATPEIYSSRLQKIRFLALQALFVPSGML
jgi:hypothetical protein